MPPSSLTRSERDEARREAYDKRMAWSADRRGRAAVARAEAKAEQAHRERLDVYAHGRRGPMAHHHTHGGRIRRAAKAGQRARRADRMKRHQDDPRTWRQRKAAA